MKRPGCLLYPLLLFLSVSCATASFKGTPDSVGAPVDAGGGNRTEQGVLHQEIAAEETAVLETLVASLDMEDALLLDPQVLHGRLDNGLTYYLRSNGEPRNRIELRLAVNVGSVLEEEDQQGLAHFLEHMAFNGTNNFARQELVEYLESIGMRFGADVNAYTSFDETVFFLQVPADDAIILEKALLILADWAQGISLEEEEIDRERGVVIEEWRLGRGAEARMRDKQIPDLYAFSRYADRLPIGKPEVIESFSPETLRRFYRDWYRPDLMAVVAVGDFDEAEMEGLIRGTFSRLEPSENPRSRSLFPVPDHEQTFVATATDPEATSSSVSIIGKQDVLRFEKVEHYRSLLVEGLYNRMLNNRLTELTRAAEAPFVQGYSASGRLSRTKAYYILGALVRDNGITGGVEALLAETERVKRFGFTETELDRGKKELLSNVERLFNERDKRSSRRLAEEYVRNFLEREPAPGIETETALYRKYLPGITLAEVERLATQLLGEESRVLLVNAPEKEGIAVPPDGELLALFDSVKELPLAAYVDRVSEAPLLASPPPSGRVVDERRIESVGLWEWELSNGLRVVLKPTDFKNDEVLFGSYSPGGHSLVEDDLYVAAITATALVTEAGVGDLDQTELRKMLAGKRARVSPWIGELFEGIGGNAAPKDLETMFQLVYLYFTAPRSDHEAFASFQERVRVFVENREASPENVFQDTVQRILSQNHHRSRPWSDGMIGEMDLETSLAIYRDRFADAGDFTFFFVGNFTLEEIKPLAETYLGGLPSTGREENWRDVDINPPPGIVEETVEIGMEPKSLVRLVFTGPFDWSRENVIVLSALTDILEIRLRESLREEQGGVYAAGVSTDPSKYPEEEYRIDIGFGTDPERVSEMNRLVFEAVASLRTLGPEVSEVEKVKEILLREREKDLRDNRFWVTVLRSYYTNGLEPETILDYEGTVRRLDAETIRRAAELFFDPDHYIKIVLNPENMMETVP
jgi:zinc protease